MKIHLFCILWAICCVSSAYGAIEVFTTGDPGIPAALFKSADSGDRFTFVRVPKESLTPPEVTEVPRMSLPRKRGAGQSHQKLNAGFVVDGRGVVVDVAIIDSTSDVLSAYFRKYIKACKFSPPLRDGGRVAMYVTMPFSLDIE